MKMLRLYYGHIDFVGQPDFKSTFSLWFGGRGERAVKL